jgi:hypothetical protein
MALGAVPPKDAVLVLALLDKVLLAAQVQAAEIIHLVEVGVQAHQAVMQPTQ